MKLERCCGILLHPTSLPGHYGIGDMGIEAYRFARFLADCGVQIWQVLPLGPTGYGDSPYQCLSAFGGNPLLISLEHLSEEGLLTQAEILDVPEFKEEKIDFGAVIHFKMPLLRLAYEKFKQAAGTVGWNQFEAFCSKNAFWLDDYSLFRALKDAHGGLEWTKWDGPVARREPEALSQWREKLAEEIEMNRFWQFEFHKQWNLLKKYCGALGVRVMGDLPIFVAHDSAEVWAHPELFHLDPEGLPTVVAGVPPDYFSATGQLWGNPIYRWERMAQTGYRWWIQRLRSVLSCVDLIRLDHFRGFEAYWEIPATEDTAINGHWVKGPGAAFFEVVEASLGDLPLIAENLGWITPEVESLRKKFGFPGMGILQFAFGTDPQASEFIPHNHVRDMVIYTGTHDNDTTLGWWTSTGETDSTRTSEQVNKERELARKYLATDGREIHWSFIRAALGSVATLAVIPLQDVLGLGSEARMNLPGKATGNWTWRLKFGALTPAIQHRLRELIYLYGRLPRREVREG